LIVASRSPSRTFLFPPRLSRSILESFARIPPTNEAPSCVPFFSVWKGLRKLPPRSPPLYSRVLQLRAWWVWWERTRGWFSLSVAAPNCFDCSFTLLLVLLISLQPNRPGFSYRPATHRRASRPDPPAEMPGLFSYHPL